MFPSIPITLLSKCLNKLILLPQNKFDQIVKVFFTKQAATIQVHKRNFRNKDVTINICDPQHQT